MTQEDLRFELQTQLDAQKTTKERNKMGQFSTPFALACSIVKYLTQLNVLAEEVDFLEPAVGSGVFYSALKDACRLNSAVGYEIDEHYYKPFAEFWKGSTLNLRLGDFLKTPPQPAFNLIISNPPYTRHHHIDSEEKKRLQQCVKNNFGIKISGLAGLYCHFMLLSTLWLKEDGVSCWLVPSEFMDVNYGCAVREFLTKQVELIAIHKFSAEDVQFSDALVTSSVVVFRNRKSSFSNKVRLSLGEDILHPLFTQELTSTELTAHLKWSALFTHTERDGFGEVPLSRYFDVTRGIATGNNSFFIISKEHAEQLRLPFEYLTPILPSPRHLKSDIVNGKDKSLDIDDPYYLLSCPLPKHELRHSYASLYNYIIEGESAEANSGYNCKKRDPWYKCESRNAAPYYMTYMGRGNNFSRMFRFILNNSEAIVPNSYLMLVPKRQYADSFKNLMIRKQIWEVLSNIPKDYLMSCGRCYGGGLYKIEPKELQAVKIPNIDGILHSNEPSLFDDI